MFLLDSADMTEKLARRAGRATLGGIAAVSAALLMTELALTRIFSVTMYYHFAFLAISIALFGLSASGVCRVPRDAPAAARSTPGTLLSATALVSCLGDARRAGVPRSHPRRPELLAGQSRLMLAIYALAALPFFTGGSVMSIAFARMRRSHQRPLRGRSDWRGRRLPRPRFRC